MKHTITNRSGLKLVIQVDEPENPTGLVFVAHGLKGSRFEPHIQTVSEVFLAHSYRVVRFDATHSVGESDGDIYDVSFDHYYNDLVDVIDWAQGEDWYSEPFGVCGHSMGAQTAAWFAEHHPERISILLPLAPVVNYESYISYMPDGGREWRQAGYINLYSKVNDGNVRVGWNAVESVKKYDLLPLAHNLTMPILDIVGSMDTTVPLTAQEKFLERTASDDKSLEVIEGAQHSYRNFESDTYGEEGEALRSILDNWLKTRE